MNHHTIHHGGLDAERRRMRAETSHRVVWHHWGPYLSERQWGTVREDYSAGGNAWDAFPHDHARSRAYRWGEDGIGGISDHRQFLCLAPAFWNGNDPILKERFFGLTNEEGNHGEDVKDYSFFLDNLPSHAYMRMLYKYPHRAFPYADLVEQNRRRLRDEPEYELIDTGIFAEDRYFDIEIAYAKYNADDIAMRIRVTNRGPERAKLDVLPTLWFRNTWSWANETKPRLEVTQHDPLLTVVRAEHMELGPYTLYLEGAGDALVTENETNYERVFGSPNAGPYVKDAFHRYLIDGETSAVNPSGIGTKFASVHHLTIAPAETLEIRGRLTNAPKLDVPFAGFSELFEERAAEADAFYAGLTPFPLSEDVVMIQRRAFAGLLWNKQFYYYVVRDWLDGDPAMPPPPDSRLHGRNANWEHLHADDIISMPDTWEYPWFAAWDLAFHILVLSLVDPAFAKRQILTLTREWYMHPSGEIPAYEWAFGDVNPPVHAWAALRVFLIDRKMNGGTGDIDFLERVFQKLIMTFTWWVNRKDRNGNNVFQGGFLGLDNIGVFDRSAPLPQGEYIDQSDGTSWMAFFAVTMLAIALELAKVRPVYEDIASKFFEHFLRIAAALNDGDPRNDHDGELWDEETGFYYDVLHLPDGRRIPMRVRSLVGLLPLLAVGVIEPETLEKLPDFTRRMDWFIRNRPDLSQHVACMQTEGVRGRRLLAACSADRLRDLLHYMLAEDEFFSPFGIRSVSQYHLEHPFVLDADGQQREVDYEPAESRTGNFGGNSNWRGPIWFPINFLLIEALQRAHYYYGDGFKVECPTNSGQLLSLWEVTNEISHRLIGIFERDERGERPVLGANSLFNRDPHWRDLIPFYEYFHGDLGHGLGANHQTGWTALVAKLIQQCGEYCAQGKTPLGTGRDAYAPAWGDLPEAVGT